MSTAQLVRSAAGPAICAILLGTGCSQDEYELPPLEWHGQRVSVGTNLGEEVCAGTLATLDREVEEIEAALGVAVDHSIPFWLLRPDFVEHHCGVGAAACSQYGKVLSGPDGLWVSRHELVHAVLRAQMKPPKRLFGEGIAVAVGGPNYYDDGCLEEPDCASTPLDVFLEAAPADFGPPGYTAGADLVAGMLKQHGPAAVIAFIAKVTPEMTPNEVREFYAQTFGRNLDEDFEAYKRGRFDEFSLAQLGCEHPLAPREQDGIHVRASSSCDSDDVVNDFAFYFPAPTSGVGHWRLVIEPEWAGTVVFSGPPLDDDEFFHVARCEPSSVSWEDRTERGPWRPIVGDLNQPFLLDAGNYVIEWAAPLDEGHELDLLVAPPCTFEAQDCPSGKQCTIWNECFPTATNLAQLGEPCEQTDGEPLACAVGGRCVNGWCIAECDSTQPCPGEQVCGPSRVCGDPCDLLGPNCAAGYSCLPTNDSDLAGAGIGQCVPAGSGNLLDICDRRENSCGEDLVCATVWVWELPMESPCREATGFEAGCCVPQCDPQAQVPDCPESLPRCEPVLDGLRGICRTLQ
jgi:hypothetical protein